MHKKKVNDKQKKIDLCVESNEKVNKNFIRSKLMSLEWRLSQNRNKYLFLMAEFENYKKRNEKDRINILRNANEDIILELLPVIDNLTHVITAYQSNKNKLLNDVVIGINMVLHQFELILGRYNLFKISVNIGDKFDHLMHDAVETKFIKSNNKEVVVLGIIGAGYKLNNKIIRPTKVIVSR